MSWWQRLRRRFRFLRGPVRGPQAQAGWWHRLGTVDNAWWAPWCRLN